MKLISFFFTLFLFHSVAQAQTYPYHRIVSGGLPIITLNPDSNRPVSVRIEGVHSNFFGGVWLFTDNKNVYARSENRLLDRTINLGLAKDVVNKSIGFNFTFDCQQKELDYVVSVYEGSEPAELIGQWQIAYANKKYCIPSTYRISHSFKFDFLSQVQQ